MENEDLIRNVQKVGNYLKTELARFPQITALRGEGLMIGFEVAPEHAQVRKKLLFEHLVFTGEAKGGVVRLLPSMALTKEDATAFLEKLEKAFH